MHASTHQTQLVHHATLIGVIIVINHTLLDTLIPILRQHHRSLLPLLLVYELLHSIWLDCWFKHRSQQTPLYVIIHHTHAICNESLFHFVTTPCTLQRIGFCLSKLGNMERNILQPLTLLPTTHKQTQVRIVNIIIIKSQQYSIAIAQCLLLLSLNLSTSTNFMGATSIPKPDSLEYIQQVIPSKGQI